MNEKRFDNAEVEAVFRSYPNAVRKKLLVLRQLIFETARATDGVGELEETLKWGQPSYVAKQTRSGSAIRIDRIKSGHSQYAMFFHCQTNLIATFRELYPEELKFEGNRSIVFDEDDEPPSQALRHCVSLALTYRLRKTRSRRS